VVRLSRSTLPLLVGLLLLVPLGAADSLCEGLGPGKGPGSTPEACEAPSEICYGIRPGALYHVKGGPDCTAGFLLRGTDRFYIVTAAHCARQVGAPVWFFHPSRDLSTFEYPRMEARPPDAHVTVVGEGWGRADGKPERDFALLELAPSALPYLSPSVCLWGGPLGLRDAPGTTLEAVYLYGHGILYHGRAEAREGRGLSWDGGPSFYAHAPAELGDSGAPLLDENRFAVGHLTNMNYGTSSSAKGIVRGLHLQALLAIPELEALGPLRLVLEGEALSDPRPSAPGAAPTPESPADQVPARTPFISLPMLAVAVGLLVLTRRRTRDR